MILDEAPLTTSKGFETLQNGQQRSSVIAESSHDACDTSSPSCFRKLVTCRVGRAKGAPATASSATLLAASFSSWPIQTDITEDASTSLDKKLNEGCSRTICVELSFDTADTQYHRATEYHASWRSHGLCIRPLLPLRSCSSHAQTKSTARSSSR